VIVGALLNFIGGAAFRYALGRIIEWLEAKQKHREETQRLDQQERFEAARHLRNQESIRLQHELGIQTIQLQGAVAADLEAARAFTAAQARVQEPTGNAFIDAWNGSIRPAAATLSLLIWITKIIEQGFKATQWDTDLASSILGFYFADRQLGKRSKA
jgi:hypothetical protein